MRGISSAHAPEEARHLNFINIDMLLLLDLPLGCCCPLIITVTQVTHCQLIWGQLPPVDTHRPNRLHQHSTTATAEEAIDVRCPCTQACNQRHSRMSVHQLDGCAPEQLLRLSTGYEQCTSCFHTLKTHYWWMAATKSCTKPACMQHQAVAAPGSGSTRMPSGPPVTHLFCEVNAVCCSGAPGHILIIISAPLTLHTTSLILHRPAPCCRCCRGYIGPAGDFARCSCAWLNPQRGNSCTNTGSRATPLPVAALDNACCQLAHVDADAGRA